MMKKLHLNSLILTTVFTFLLSLQTQAQTFTFSDSGPDHSAGVGFRTIDTTPASAGPFIVSNSMHWNGITSLIPTSGQVGVDVLFTIKGVNLSATFDDMVWRNFGGNATLTTDTKIVFKDIGGGVLDSWLIPGDVTLTSNNPISVLTIFGKTGGLLGVTEIEVTIDYGTSLDTSGFNLDSVTLNTIVLGVDENNFTDATVLYPNPTTGNLNIELGNRYESVNVQVTNTLGQVITSFNKSAVAKLQFTLNTSPGMYFVKVSTENNGRAYYKVLVE